MNYETKRDVFVRLAEDLKINDSFDEEYPKSQEYIEKKYKENIHNYDAALPDNLPVIPEAVGEMLRSAYGKTNLLGVLETARNGRKISYILAWMFANQNASATAWVLGVWRVEKTGEIAKLEVDK